VALAAIPSPHAEVAVSVPSLLDPHRLAARLATLLHEGRLEPLVLGWPAPGGATPAVLPLAGRHPLEVLWGLTAPSAWLGVAVLASGSLVAGRDRRVAVATVATRSGHDASVVLDRRGRHLVDEPAVGLVPDALHRVLDRPTPPPSEPVTVWWAMEWLDDLADLLTSSAGRPTLEAVVACHPAVDPDEIVGSEALLAWFVERGLDHAHLTGWDGVRQGIAQGVIGAGVCPAELADWFDSGSFSRFARAVRAEPRTRLDELADRLGPALTGAIGEVLHAWSRSRRWMVPDPADGAG
jgi:hypothetical protein